MTLARPLEVPRGSLNRASNYRAILNEKPDFGTTSRHSVLRPREVEDASIARRSHRVTSGVLNRLHLDSSPVNNSANNEVKEEEKKGKKEEKKGKKEQKKYEKRWKSHHEGHHEGHHGYQYQYGYRYQRELSRSASNVSDSER